MESAGFYHYQKMIKIILLDQQRQLIEVLPVQSGQGLFLVKTSFFMQQFMTSNPLKMNNEGFCLTRLVVQAVGY